MNREETIKWLESLKTEIGKSEHRTLWHYAEAIDMAIEALKAETEWVPCDTGGMSPEGEEVLVSNGRHIWIDESVAGDITEEGCMMWWGDGSDWIDTAWMPLPKPYKGGDDE